MTVREHIVLVLNKRIKDDKIISQVALANILEVTESAISKLMKTGQIDNDKILKLCDALKISPNEVLGYDENIEDRELLDILNSDPDLKTFVLSRKK